jgi:hypothetical protein
MLYGSLLSNPSILPENIIDASEVTQEFSLID